jgi:hypothetical protein
MVLDCAFGFSPLALEPFPGRLGTAVFKVLGRYFRDLAANPNPTLLFILAV